MKLLTLTNAYFEEQSTTCEGIRVLRFTNDSFSWSFHPKLLTVHSTVPEVRCLIQGLNDIWSMLVAFAPIIFQFQPFQTRHYESSLNIFIFLFNVLKKLFLKQMLAKMLKKGMLHLIIMQTLWECYFWMFSERIEYFFDEHMNKNVSGKNYSWMMHTCLCYVLGMSLESR